MGIVKELIKSVVTLPKEIVEGITEGIEETVRGEKK